MFHKITNSKKDLSLIATGSLIIELLLFAFIIYSLYKSLKIHSSSTLFISPWWVLIIFVFAILFIIGFYSSCKISHILKHEYAASTNKIIEKLPD